MLLLLNTGCGKQRGVKKYPVRGQVMVNGEAAAGVIVRFHDLSGTLVGQDTQPAAITDTNGQFQLSSYGDNDGAAPGEYGVTFYWPTQLLGTGEDRLRGQFSDLASSTFRVTVAAREMELAPFTLSIDPKQLLPASEMDLRPAQN